MDHPLYGIRAKLDRSREHFQTLNSEISAFVHANPNPIIVERDEETGEHVVLFESLPPSPGQRLGVLLGDFIHNLRSALDHLVWQLVIANGKTPKSGPNGNRFPIIRQPPGKWIIDAAPDALRGLSSEAVQLVSRFQPYNPALGYHRPAEHPLARLNRLSNTDKHQVVHAAAIASGPKGTGLAAVSGAITGLKFGHTAGKRLQDEREILRFRVREDATPDEVYVDANVRIDIAFGEREPLTRIEGLSEIGKLVNRVVDEAEPLFS